MPADTRAPRSGFLGSMKLTASVDRSTIARSGTSRVIAVIEVAAPVDVEAAEATPRGVVFAIDVSTSMAGEPLAQVVRSTEWLIEVRRRSLRLSWPAAWRTFRCRRSTPWWRASPRTRVVARPPRSVQGPKK